MAEQMTPDQLSKEMLGLAEMGLVVPAWNVALMDIVWWPAWEVPADANRMSLEEAKRHLDHQAASDAGEWN